MRYFGAVLVLLMLSACGGGSGSSSGSSASVKNIYPTAGTAIISGTIDLNGATIEGAVAPTVEVDGLSATVTPAGGDIYDWTATVPSNTIYDTFRVECFVNDNLVMAFDYALDP